jgi:hypothetical protein
MCVFATLEIPDLLRAGAVCASWRSAYICIRTHGKYRQSQTPCLLFTSESAGEDVACVLCLAEPETALHLLATCPVTIRLWQKILSTANLPLALAPTAYTTQLQDWISIHLACCPLISGRAGRC